MYISEVYYFKLAKFKFKKKYIKLYVYNNVYYFLRVKLNKSYYFTRTIKPWGYLP